MRIKNQFDRVKHIVDSAYNGKKLVLFPEVDTPDFNENLESFKQVLTGTAHGAYFHAPSFHRPESTQIEYTQSVSQLFLGKA